MTMTAVVLGEQLAGLYGDPATLHSLCCVL